MLHDSMSSHPPNALFRSASVEGPRISSQEVDETRSSPVRKSVEKVEIKKLEVGAGAKINQSIHDDPEPLDFWREEPEAIICINY